MQIDRVDETIQTKSCDRNNVVHDMPRFGIPFTLDILYTFDIEYFSHNQYKNHRLTV